MEPIKLTFFNEKDGADKGKIGLRVAITRGEERDRIASRVADVLQYEGYRYNRNNFLYQIDKRDFDSDATLRAFSRQGFKVSSPNADQFPKGARQDRNDFGLRIKAFMQARSLKSSAPEETAPKSYAFGR